MSHATELTTFPHKKVVEKCSTSIDLHFLHRSPPSTWIHIPCRKFNQFPPSPIFHIHIPRGMLVGRRGRRVGGQGVAVANPGLPRTGVSASPAELHQCICISFMARLAPRPAARRLAGCPRPPAPPAKHAAIPPPPTLHLSPPRAPRGNKLL
jgi:hypothetical protein